MDVVEAVCLSVVGLSIAGLLVLGVEPGWLTGWLNPPLEEVPTPAPAPEVSA